MNRRFKWEVIILNLKYVIWIILSAFILGIGIEKKKLYISLSAGASLFISSIIGLFELVKNICLWQ